MGSKLMENESLLNTLNILNLYDTLKKHTGANSVFQTQLRVAELP